MGRKRTPGLYKRKGIWHIDKTVQGRRLCESCGTDNLEEAEKYLARQLESLRQASVYGVRPKRLFREAATKYLLDNPDKPSLYNDTCALKQLDKFIGHLSLESVHIGSLQGFIKARQADKVKNRTINYGLEVVRHILNLCANEWLDECGLSWLEVAPKIRLLPRVDRREPYPLSFEEQDRLFQELPSHLRSMALFAVNTGCRDKEICSLRWEWEVPISEGGTVFIVPRHCVKNREERLVVLNAAARSVVDSLRGQHSEYVFPYKGKPISGMLNSAWKKARMRASLPQVRVHDLKHTFGRRLRAAGVSFEDRQDLLGHKSGRITTHYSRAELSNLLDAANKACDRKSNSPALTLLRAGNWMVSRSRVLGIEETAEPGPAKFPQAVLQERGNVA
jgi:integrase